MSVGAQSPADICRGYLDAFSTGQPDNVAAFVTDDFINEHTAALGGGCVGIDEYRKRLPCFLSSMPGLRYDIEDVVAEGDHVLAADGFVVDDTTIAIGGATWTVGGWLRRNFAPAGQPDVVAHGLAEEDRIGDGAGEGAAGTYT